MTYFADSGLSLSTLAPTRNLAVQGRSAIERCAASLTLNVNAAELKTALWRCDLDAELPLLS
jgi:hypothetical protein